MFYKDTLLTEIRKLNDSSYEKFVGFPATCPLACGSWSECIYLFSKDVVPYSNTTSTAKSSMKESLLGICSSSSLEQSVAIFESSVISYASQLAAGMAISGFTGIVPSAPLTLLPIFKAAMAGGAALQFAVDLSEKLDVWFKMGVAIHNESGTIINWN